MITVDVYYRDQFICIMTFKYTGNSLVDIIIDNYSNYLKVQPAIFKVQFEKFVSALKIMFSRKELLVSEVDLNLNKISFDYTLPSSETEGYIEINTRFKGV